MRRMSVFQGPLARALILSSLITLAGCGGNGSDEVVCEKQGATLDEGLRLRDLECGTGTTAAKGMSATVAYSASLKGDEPFDESDGDEFVFRLGSGQVVTGWDEGLVGMQVGGTRELTVPPELAYGEAGFSPHVPPNATVIYEVELLEITDPDEDG